MSESLSFVQFAVPSSFCSSQRNASFASYAGALAQHIINARRRWENLPFALPICDLRLLSWAFLAKGFRPETAKGSFTARRFPTLCAKLAQHTSTSSSSSMQTVKKLNLCCLKTSRTFWLTGLPFIVGIVAWSFPYSTPTTNGVNVWAPFYVHVYKIRSCCLGWLRKSPRFQVPRLVS